MLHFRYLYITVFSLFQLKINIYMYLCANCFHIFHWSLQYRLYVTAQQEFWIFVSCHYTMCIVFFKLDIIPVRLLTHGENCEVCFPLWNYMYCYSQPESKISGQYGHVDSLKPLSHQKVMPVLTDPKLRNISGVNALIWRKFCPPLPPSQSS